MSSREHPQGVCEGCTALAPCLQCRGDLKGEADVEACEEAERAEDVRDRPEGGAAEEAGWGLPSPPADPPQACRAAGSVAVDSNEPKLPLGVSTRLTGSCSICIPQWTLINGPPEAIDAGPPA